MPPFHRFSAVLSLGLLAACSTEMTSPSSDRAAVAPDVAITAAPASVPGWCSQPTTSAAERAFGHKWMPIGDARLKTNPAGALRVISRTAACEGGGLNESMSDIFGAVVERIQGSQDVGVIIGQFMRLPEPGATFEVTFGGNTGTLFQLGFTRRPNGAGQGYMDYLDDACMDLVTTRKNGEVLRINTGPGRITFPLLAGIEILGWATFPSDYRSVITASHGTDQFEISLTPSNPSTCRKNPRVIRSMAMQWARGTSTTCPAGNVCRGFKVEMFVEE